MATTKLPQIMIKLLIYILLLAIFLKPGVDCCVGGPLNVLDERTDVLDPRTGQTLVDPLRDARETREILINQMGPITNPQNRPVITDLNSLPVNRVVSSGSDLSCSFGSQGSCCWANPNEVELYKFVFLDGKLSSNRAKQYLVQPNNPNDSPFVAAAGNFRSIFPDRYAVLTSCPIACQNTEGTLSFDFYNSKDVTWHVCVLQLDAGYYSSCERVNPQSSRGSIIIPAQPQPFTLSIIAGNFSRYPGSSAIVDNIDYDAQMCGSTLPSDKLNRPTLNGIEDPIGLKIQDGEVVESDLSAKSLLMDLFLVNRKWDKAYLDRDSVQFRDFKQDTVSIMTAVFEEISGVQEAGRRRRRQITDDGSLREEGWDGTYNFDRCKRTWYILLLDAIPESKTETVAQLQLSPPEGIETLEKQVGIIKTIIKQEQRTTTVGNEIELIRSKRQNSIPLESQFADVICKNDPTHEICSFLQDTSAPAAARDDKEILVAKERSSDDWVFELCRRNPNHPFCPSECGEGSCILTEWTPWSDCSERCDGLQERTRQLIESPCPGLCPKTVENRVCNEGLCADSPCKLTDWTPWTECSETCGGGITLRFREIITTPDPSLCASFEESRVCNSQPCPKKKEGCTVKKWEEWSPCSESCGRSGLRYRYRDVKELGDADCPTLDQEEPCNIISCKRFETTTTTKKPTTKRPVSVTTIPPFEEERSFCELNKDAKLIECEDHPLSPAVQAECDSFANECGIFFATAPTPPPAFTGTNSPFIENVLERLESKGVLNLYIEDLGEFCPLLEDKYRRQCIETPYNQCNDDFCEAYFRHCVDCANLGTKITYQEHCSANVFFVAPAYCKNYGRICLLQPI